MLENGFIKLHRSLLKWEWYDDINVFKLFIHLLLTVNLYDEKWQGKIIKRGTRVTSYSVLSRETKLSIQQIRTALKKLSSTGELTIKKTSKYTVVTVNNYDKFQSLTQTSTQYQHSENGILCKQTVNNQNMNKNATRTSTQYETQIFPTVEPNFKDEIKKTTQTLTNNQHSTNTVSTQYQQQREKVKESIRKYKKVERGSETLPNATPTPTLEQVIDFVFENNLRVNPNKFYYYYENKGWKGVNNWKMKLMEWNETERPQQNNFENKTGNNVSFDLDKYEQQLRQTPSLDWLD